MTITEFLNARYDEDETLARESIIDASHWSVFAVNEHFGQVDSDDGAIANNVDLKDAAHIVRWDPARVLADIAAKRAIVQLYEGSGLRIAMGQVVRLLAQPYAEHPDFDESWKP